MTLVLGVDGCPGGWCCVPIRLTASDLEVLPSVVLGCFGEVLGFPAEVICVDIPIGLLCGGQRRECDAEARSRLGAKSSSVFDPPCRHSLHCYDHPSATIANDTCTGRGLSIMSFGFMPKVREVDAVMHPHLQDSVKEIHPELCFSALNGGVPIAAKKSRVVGRIRRWETLHPHLQRLPLEPPKPSDLTDRCKPDDYIDALVAAWTAVCILRGTATCIPSDPPFDPRGLRMEMWYPAPRRLV
jgi:predicted RNase H-like nuclease